MPDGHDHIQPHKSISVLYLCAIFRIVPVLQGRVARVIAVYKRRSVTLQGSIAVGMDSAAPFPFVWRSRIRQPCLRSGQIFPNCVNHISGIVQIHVGTDRQA